MARRINVFCSIQRGLPIEPLALERNAMKTEHNYREPVYTIGVTAKLLNVCAATLRIWERRGLIKPERLGKNRFYSRCDVERLDEIRELLREKKINIQGVRTVLNTRRCWELKKCKPKERNACVVYQGAKAV